MAMTMLEETDDTGSDDRAEPKVCAVCGLPGMIAAGDENHYVCTECAGPDTVEIGPARPATILG